MTDGKSGWNPQAWRGYSERVGQWWRLTKGSRAVTCDIWTHPLGGELRCEVDGEMFGTRASRDVNDLLDASDAWKAAFQEKGWLG
jgi:hypothetical protein